MEMNRLSAGDPSKSGGINDPSVGSFFGVNGDGATREAMAVSQLWYEQAFFDETLRIRFGKLDITAALIVAAVLALMATLLTMRQFLNGVRLITDDPFSDYGLGAAAIYSPVSVVHRMDFPSPGGLPRNGLNTAAPRRGLLVQHRRDWLSQFDSAWPPAQPTA
jgi:hypothetical protein